MTWFIVIRFCSSYEFRTIFFRCCLMLCHIVGRWVWASCQIGKLAGCACAGNAGNVFPPPTWKETHQLAIPVCITARASRTCRDACRDRYPTGRGKRSRHSRRICNPQFYVPGKRPMSYILDCSISCLYYFIQLVVPQEIRLWSQVNNVKTHIKDIYLRDISCEITLSECHKTSLIIGSGHGLVSPGIKSLPEPILIRFYLAIWSD